MARAKRPPDGAKPLKEETSMGALRACGTMSASTALLFSRSLLFVHCKLSFSNDKIVDIKDFVQLTVN